MPKPPILLDMGTLSNVAKYALTERELTEWNYTGLPKNYRIKNRLKTTLQYIYKHLNKFRGSCKNSLFSFAKSVIIYKFALQIT